MKEYKTESRSVRDDASDRNPDGVTMILWTRRPVCGPRADVIDRLTALRSSGAISEYRIRTWPDEVRISEQTDDLQVLTAYEEFARWARDRGVTITPPFERRTRASFVGRSEEILRVPVLCLAVYDDELRGVFPCQDGSRTWTVADFLDAYEGAEEAPPETLELAGFPPDG